MCGPVTKPFTPVGIRKDVHETGPLYHGTKADLNPGELLKPGFPSNYGAHRIANFVYVTAILDGAALAAQLSQGDGPGRMYIVESTGPVEDDPNVTDQKFPGNPSRSQRTRSPLRVVEEVPNWTPLPPEALDKTPQAYGSGRSAGDRSHQRMIRCSPLSALAWYKPWVKGETPDQRAFKRCFCGCNLLLRSCNRILVAGLP